MRLLNQYIARFLSMLFSPFARIWGFMRRVIPGLKVLPTLKPEVLAAVLCFIFLILIAVVQTLILTAGWYGTENVSWGRLPVLFLVAFVTPVVVYFGVKIFLAPPKSPFPDIDLAFEAGINALAKNGIQLKDAPLYLVLGTPDSKVVRKVMRASGREFDFSHTTADGQALHWYGAADHIYVFLTGIGNVCQLTKDLAKYVNQASPDDAEYSGDNFKGTIDVSGLGKGNAPSAPALSPPPIESFEAADRFSATIQPGEIGVASTPTRTEQPPNPPKSRQTKQLSSREKLAIQKRRLTHFCQLLSRSRRPVCAINGIIVLMSSRLVEEFPGELARQTKKDLSTITTTTGVVSTVTAVVNGFENYEGCREFVFRLSEMEGASFLQRRFGKSYRSWEAPSPGHLKEISNNSVEIFDKYVYSIFTGRDALSSRNVIGNRNMVKFLCWLYARFYEGLEITLTTGFNVDSASLEDFPRFSGCYFIGAGDSEETTFFTNGVFDRVDENQGELEWTSAVTQKEEAMSLMSQLVFLAGLLASRRVSDHAPVVSARGQRETVVRIQSENDDCPC